MRNLSLAKSTWTILPDVCRQSKISAAAVDPECNVLYVTSECETFGTDVDVEIYKIANKNGHGAGDVSKLAVVTVAAFPKISTCQTISLKVSSESNSLVLITRRGDITMVYLDNENPSVEVEGTVEHGILAASWSPDESLLVLVTDEGKLILMTSTFDVLSEGALHRDEFGEDVPINVGWGSKQTQFHGSLGKAAAQAKYPPTASIGSSPDDDAVPRISWRGDGAFFVVSSLYTSAALPRRILRVYDRQAALQSTSEPVAGLEHTLSWRPSGNLIVGTQRFGSFEGGGVGKEGRHDVVFFERNGLRHGEFGIRVGVNEGKGQTVKTEEKKCQWGYKVKELGWSSDSNVLGIWIERDGGDVVQLWTTGNYHWYLKQEITAPSSSFEPGRFTSVNWHPEQALCLILTTSSEVIQQTYAWETFTSRRSPPYDSGCVAVVDGTTILLTPFRTQNMPPPMSGHRLSMAQSVNASRPHCPPIHVSFSSTRDTLVLLWDSGYFELWNLNTRLGPGKEKIMDPVMTVGCNASGLDGRQVALWNGSDAGDYTAVLGSEKSGVDVVMIIQIAGCEKKHSWSVKLPQRNGRLVATNEGIVWQANNGEIFEVDFRNGTVLLAGNFPEFCFHSECVSVQNTPKYVGLADSGKLYLSVGPEGGTTVLSTNVTSFTITSGFVVFTSTSHEASFIPLTALALPTSPPQWEKRRIERGSRIVTAVPSTMSLVLQMPRGNLETINPRPLVREVLKQDLDARNYRKAFFSCRKHRIDLNVIVDHDQTAFLDHLGEFVDQVDDVDHINLFLSSLGRGSQSPEMVTKLCDAVRVELEKRDLRKYVNSILTAYVVKTPPDHESGLMLLLRLRENNQHLVEDAVKYIIFLVDADQLFDTALGMYDFSLVLMIAQHAQKDPREYLPFLRELRALSKYYQRFRIDDHLRRYDKALRNLSLAGTEHFDEAMAYVEQHQLYETALSIWKGTEHYLCVLNIYGDWLFERREFKQAALVFVQGKSASKALVAHEKALEWQELFDLAVLEKIPEENISVVAYRIAENLSSKKRYAEAARVLLDYAKDVREAVIALVQGNSFSEARRITSLNGVPDLLLDIIYPGALESRAQIAEDINEMREQLRKQVSRLQELRIKRVEKPDSFYGVEDTNLENIDVMTDFSMPATAFTRYTIAPSATSKASKRSSRSKRKMERKVGSGRKGTVDEEEYLLKSVTKLVGRFNTTQGEARDLLPHLLNFTEEHQAEAASLRKDLSRFSQELQEALGEIWDQGPGEAPGGWAKRMEERERESHINAVEKVGRPEIAENEWRMLEGVL